MKGSNGWQRRQRPLRNLCLFASLRRSRAIIIDAQHQKLAETLSAAPAQPPPSAPPFSSARQKYQKHHSMCLPAAQEELAELHCQGSQEVKSDSPPPAHGSKRHRPRQEGDHMSSPPFLSSMPLSCRAVSSSSFHYHHHWSYSHNRHHYPHRQPETPCSADRAGGGDISIPSQLPTFSLDSPCYDTSAGAGGGGHLVLLPATDTQGPLSLRMQAEEEEEEAEKDFAATTSTSRMATWELFPGPGVLEAVRAKLRQDVVHLKNHGQEGSHRYVMQEMALMVLERDNVEYVVQEVKTEERKKRRGWRRGRKVGSDTQQLGFALEELQKGVMAPAGLDPRQTHILGLAPDILADISLMVQGYGGEQEQERWVRGEG